MVGCQDHNPFVGLLCSKAPHESLQKGIITSTTFDPHFSSQAPAYTANDGNPSIRSRSKTLGFLVAKSWVAVKKLFFRSYNRQALLFTIHVDFYAGKLI